MANRIRLQKSYYVSLCWYGLKRLGFLGQQPEPGMEKWIERLSGTGQQFGFCAPVAGGPLFRFLYQIPGYLNPASVSETRDIFRAAVDLLRYGNIANLLAGWPDQTRHWDRWYHPLACEQIREEFASNGETACRVLFDWADYLEEIWYEYLPVFEKKLRKYPFEDYEAHCNQLLVFELWNESFGNPYPYTDFIVIICPESATLASSLGPEKIVFDSRFDYEKLYWSVIHEIGVRYPSSDALAASPETAGILKKDYVGLLRLIETEVCYRKNFLFPNLGEDKFAIGMGLQKLIAWRKGQDIRSFDSIAGFLSFLYQEANNQGLLASS